MFLLRGISGCCSRALTCQQPRTLLLSQNVRSTASRASVPEESSSPPPPAWSLMDHEALGVTPMPALEASRKLKERFEKDPKDAVPRKRFEYGSKSMKELGYDVFPYYIERAWFGDIMRKRAYVCYWAHWRQLRDLRVRQLVADWGPDRMRFKAMKTNNILPRAIIDEFRDKMIAMPRKAHPNMIIQMCQFTGKRRGKFNRYRVNRHIFRHLADHAHLSGWKRAMW